MSSSKDINPTDIEARGDAALSTLRASALSNPETADIVKEFLAAVDLGYSEAIIRETLLMQHTGDPLLIAAAADRKAFVMARATAVALAFTCFMLAFLFVQGSSTSERLRMLDAEIQKANQHAADAADYARFSALLAWPSARSTLLSHVAGSGSGPVLPQDAPAEIKRVKGYQCESHK